MLARLRKILIAGVVCLPFGSIAKADLAGRIDSILSRSSQKNVQFSIHIINARLGAVVYSHNAKRPMIPASNMKIITTAAALKYLGPDYSYETKVGLAGDTLVAIGSGDPLLGDRATDAKYGREPGWIFEDIVTALEHNSIKTIKNMVVDTSVFDDQRVHPSWPQKELNRWYACEVSGLNYNDNCIELTVKKINGKISIFIRPPTNFVKLVNKVTPVTKGISKVGSYRTVTPNKIIIHGKCNRQAGPFEVAVERPAAFFGFLLAENLAKAGIKAEGQFIEKTLDDYRDIKFLTRYNTSITDCLARCNKNSLGLAAEALLKTIAAHSNPGRKNGGWKKGRQLISQYLLKIGVDKSQFYIDDGSGLSKQNKLTAYAITKVLFNIYKSRNWKLYQDSLAIAGIDGTISRYFKEQKYKGKIFGKTGYIRGVKTFSGFCTTEKADFIFSILANNANSQTRTALNDIAKAIMDDAE